MKVFYFSLTKGKKVNCLLHQTIKFVDGVEIYFKECNKMSIAKAYNKAIDFCIKENVDYLVLCHDDVILENVTEAKLLENFDQFDMFGVAGATECKLEKPVLWHLMGGGFGSGNLHGAVSHLQPGCVKSMTSFGSYPHRAVIIDGVFMAIKREVFEKVRFDEKCPAKWHHYDLDYSMAAHKAGFKVGVGDILITHASPGLSEFTPEFNAGQDWFLEKWGAVPSSKKTIKRKKGKRKTKS
jgi:GT2 family glycosyltransferase